MELIGKLESDNTTKIGMLPCDSEYVPIQFSDKCLHMINNKEGLNGIKGNPKMQKEFHYSNINNVYTIFKETLVLITEVHK